MSDFSRESAAMRNMAAAASLHETADAFSLMSHEDVAGLIVAYAAGCPVIDIRAAREFFHDFVVMVRAGERVRLAREVKGKEIAATCLNEAATHEETT